MQNGTKAWLIPELRPFCPTKDLVAKRYHAGKKDEDCFASYVSRSVYMVKAKWLYKEAWFQSR